MYIDSHVHCRDFEETHKEIIAHALRVAEDSGLSAIFDMPNTKPATIDSTNAERRLRIAKNCNSPIFYGLYIGLTADTKQIKEAVQIQKLHFPKPGDRTGVIGLKMFAGKSVGDLSVVNYEEQGNVYDTLAGEGFEGVLAVHCEKEDEMKSELWNSHIPRTHALARPEDSEIYSVTDQIWLAQRAGYEGNLHICHVSVPASVDIINNNRDNLKISCGVTPHHLLLDYTTMDRENGILYKVNPPLRSPETRQKLFEKFMAGEIDILETDHAPHTYEEKTEKFMSGIPSLASWPDFAKLLLERGVSPQLIEDVAYKNINKIFKTNIPQLILPVKPGEHLKKYAFDAYHKLKEDYKE